jgi:hypothetical protein
MRSEEAIRKSLEITLKQLDIIKAEYNKYIGTMYEDMYITDVRDEWTALESKANTLLWVLGDVVRG